jgi:hypothetical protein
MSSTITITDINTDIITDTITDIRRRMSFRLRRRLLELGEWVL